MSKISEDILARAKDMYMQYKPLSEVASILGVNRDSLQYYVNKKWKSERVLRANELLSEFSDSKIALMSNTFSDSFNAIKKWVEIKARNPEELRPHEVKTMMSIITEMDKITRLDAGSPTDIIENTAPVDVIEVRKKIVKSDPFLEEADYRELSHDEENIKNEIESPEDSTTN